MAYPAGIFRRGRVVAGLLATKPLFSTPLTRQLPAQHLLDMARIPMTNGLRVSVVAVLFAWMLFLAILGFTQLISIPVSDKALHFVGFGIMGVLVFFSFQAAIPRRKVWKLTVLSMATACVFSEVLQRLLTSRAFDWRDIGANILGTCTFLFAGWMVDKWIIQPRAGGQNYRDSASYWVISPGDAERTSIDLEAEDELDVELDEILVNTPPPSRDNR
ncbi:hypothetical protein GQ54DRAFT_196470 [Martensiomyces pterosporus]|nr:hypothetical protein GQ54DRAFT_196470 [Martensiomyces pterosporus]